MRKKCRGKDGAISVFLTIIMVPVLVVSFLFVDVSRIKLAQSVVDSAGDLTMNTVMSQCDMTLNDYYGLMASSQDIESFMATANDYFTACIVSQGVDVNDAKKYSQEIINLINGEESEISDLLQICEVEGAAFQVSAVENGTLENPALMKKEIVEFMKYRAPIDGIAELLDLFQKSSGTLENSSKDAKLVEKKQKFYEAEGEVMECALEVYQAIQEYEKNQITEAEIEQMKTDLAGVRDIYYGIHYKMVTDLYNTEGKAGFVRPDLSINYQVSYTQADAESRIDGYLKDYAEDLRDYQNAKNNLNKAYNNLVKYDASTMYDLQYWVYCYNTIQPDNGKSAYGIFVSAASALNQSRKKVEACMNVLAEEQKSQAYNLKKYKNVDTFGEKSRSDHYASLNAQYDREKEGFEGVNSAYCQITGWLTMINTQNFLGRTSTAGVDQQLRDLNTRINGYYARFENLKSILKDMDAKVKDLKKATDEYGKSFDSWSKEANAIETDLAQDDREEINKLESGVKKEVTEESVKALQTRISNVRTLLTNLQDGIDEYKYNGTKIRDIDSYSTFKKKSGVKESEISYISNALVNYANGSFSFQISDKLGQTPVTNDNNPALQVNSPALYSWIKEHFSNYDQSKREEGEAQYEGEKNKYDSLLDGADQPNDTSSDNEISVLENLPSAAYSKDDQGGLVSSNLSKIAGFISGLFTDFTATVSQAAVDLRDDLYTVDYIMQMFSYDTWEKEGKYHLCSDVTMGNYAQKYAQVDGQWKSEDLKFSQNKSLTNKLISLQNNYSFGNEVEYILYGNTNEKNKSSAYGSIFAIRFVMNLFPEMQRHWSVSAGGEAVALEGIAQGVQGATYGIIPAPLFKLVVILGLTAAEASWDLQYLKNGMPVELVKSKDDVEYVYGLSSLSPDTNRVKKESPGTFFYSDYLSMLLFLKLTLGDEYAIYARTADVIQANMDQQIVADSGGFRMSNAIVYFSAETKVKVNPLMLDLPLASDYADQLPEDSSWNEISYEIIRGY